MMGKTNRKEAFCLVFILLLASFLRLWKLDSIPPGLYPDEAINGNEAVFSPGKIFYRENNGREGLFINLVSLSFKIFGISVSSLRLVSAICGILTVLGLYLLIKELFSGLSSKVYGLEHKKIALLASFFLATSFWHVNFSRIAFRAILVPFTLVFAFYFLFRGFRQKKILDFIVSGAVLGLGFYTYISYRFVVVLVALIFLYQWLICQKEEKKKFLLFTLYCLLSTIIVALPIGIYFLKNPKDFISRVAPIVVFSQKAPLKAFGKSLVSHLAMFHIFGDPNWRHNVSGAPILFWPVGILFLIGFCYSIKEVLSKKSLISYPKSTSLKFKSPNIAGHWLLLIWFFIMLLPGILTAEGTPHALRCIGAIPPTFAFAGLGGFVVFKFIGKKISLKTRGFNYYLIIFCLIFLTFSFILAQYFRYFELWAKNPRVKDAFTKHYVDIGHYLNSLPPETKKYVIVNELGAPLYGISIPAQTPMFIETTKFGYPRSIYLKAENLDEIEINEEKVTIVPLYNGRLFNKLQEKFPQGTIKQEKGVNVYKIE